MGAVDATWGIVVLNEAPTSLPACATSANSLSFDKSTQHGRDMLAVALTALATGKSLRVFYSDTICGWNGPKVLPLATRFDVTN